MKGNASKVAMDKDIRDSIYQMLSRNPFSIRAIKNIYLTDDMWRYCIDEEPSVFKYIKEYQRVPSLSLCMYALRADGQNIQYIHPDRVSDYMISIAEKTYPRARDLVGKCRPYHTATPRPVIEKMNAMANEDILNKLRANPGLIKTIKNPTEEMICTALLYNPDTVLYFDEITESMANILEEYYPQIAPLYPNYLAYKETHKATR